MVLRNKISEHLNITVHNGPVNYEVIKTKSFPTYERQLITYTGNEEDTIAAYLFLPKGRKIKGAILVHHQHNGQRHLGKSEVSGIEGDPFQFFCPGLCEQGFITLAPDSICFEDRRPNQTGTTPDPDEDNDFLQHFNEMCYRLLRNDSLMKKVIEDSSIGISLLETIRGQEKWEIGILGHSYGGNTVIFHSALDERIQVSCSSGAVCSYQTKMEFGTGIEFAEVIPGFVEKFDIEELLACIAPRKMLIVSADQDKYSQDARALYSKTKSVYEDSGNGDNLFLKEYEGGHALTKERFEYIANWFSKE